MSTYTKEQLIARINQVTAINKYRMSRDPEADGLAMDNELLAIALASLEAEAVGFIVRNKNTGQFGSWMHSKADWFKDDGYEVLSAYIAPPAPVSVPAELTREEYKRRFMEEDDFDATFRGGWNACRSAMLQGADGNSPVVPDGYALVPVEPTTNQWAAGMQAFDSGMDKVTRVYKAMLAAAPQQE